MKMKIAGRSFATITPVRTEIMVDLKKDVQLTIAHNELFSTVTLGEDVYRLEIDSLEYDFVAL